jgi:poly(A) polymerase-like protein
MTLQTPDRLMRTEHQVIDLLNSSPAVKAVRELAMSESVDVYLYGGALRDYFLGLTPTDLDFLVPGDPAEFAHKIGALAQGEVRTFPSHIGNIGYYNGELGKLDFIPNGGLTIEEYLCQRLDFTINSLVFDIKEGKLLFFHNSKADLQNRLIRAIGPTAAMSNPANIPLRAVRLALLAPDFKIDSQTYSDIKCNRAYVKKARPSRIGYELSNILDSSEYLRGIQLLDDLGLLQEILTTFLPFAEADLQQKSDSIESPLGAIVRMYRTIDELTAPFETFLSSSVPKYALLLRLVVLLLPRIRQTFLEIRLTERNPFLVTKGAQIENALFDLGVIPGRAFRVRMIAIGYLLGIASLFDQTAGLEEAAELCIRTFGPWKGFLASTLICADWLCSNNGDSPNPSDVRKARQTLEGRMPLLAPHRIEK